MRSLSWRDKRIWTEYQQKLETHTLPIQDWDQVNLHPAHQMLISHQNLTARLRASLLSSFGSCRLEPRPLVACHGIHQR